MKIGFVEMASKGEKRPCVESLDRLHLCIDIEKFPDSPFVPCLEQTVEYLANVRGLNNSGLNPQLDVNKLDVIDANMIEVFGPSKRFTTSNPD